MLASLVEKPISNSNWLYEPKLDGVRALAYVNEGKISLNARSSIVITERYREVVRSLAELSATQLVLDGEIVALNDRGLPDFELLQERMHVKGTPQVEANRPVVYYIFDVLYADGRDLTALPLLDRKTLLKPATYAGSGTLPEPPTSPAGRPEKSKDADRSARSAPPPKTKRGPERSAAARESCEAATTRIKDARAAAERERREAAERRLRDARAAVEASAQVLSAQEGLLNRPRQEHEDARKRVEQIDGQRRLAKLEVEVAERTVLTAKRERDKAEKEHDAARKKLEGTEQAHGAHKEG